MASRSAAGGGRHGAWPYPELVLAVLGALSVLPPYIGPPLGLDLKVAADVEVVDHVVAGTVVALGAALAALLARRAQRAGLSDPGLALAALCGLCFLGGLWQVATHVPLVLDGGSPEAPWGTVALHSTAGVPIAALALWLTLRTPD
jgi:hypothetical protein